jgi:hypothetical protein
MDERPDLLSEAVGDAAVLDAIDVGGGDAVVVTRGTTYVYRSDGLLKDESVERFDHDIERLSMRTKRGKSSIQLERIDGEASFTVPSKAVDGILEAMVQGILLTNDVLDDGEEVLSLFRFSELTLVVTDRRLFKHVGSAVWDSDFEAVAYGDLSGIDFERGDFGTQVVLETDTRRQRVKVPNEHAGTVRREIQDTVCEFYGVASMEALRDEFDESAEDGADADADAADREGPEDGAESGTDAEDSFVSAGWSPAADREGSDDDAESPRSRQSADGNGADGAFDSDEGGTPERSDVDALADRVDELSEQVERQTELIESQQELIEQLVDELRRGR